LCAQTPDTATIHGHVIDQSRAGVGGVATIYDQRNRFVLSGVPLKIHFSGVATLASGLPFNYTTGTTNSGATGATTDRPVIDGEVVGRNVGHGRPIYSIDPALERAFRHGAV
jgi:hypothetical protein